jgi:hypothetical protein
VPAIRVGVAAAAGPEQLQRLARAFDLDGKGARQESPQVAHPVAAIAARIDPIEAKPARLAPGSDRVRVDPQDLRGPCHRQRRIEWLRPG